MSILVRGDYQRLARPERLVGTDGEELQGAVLVLTHGNMNHRAAQALEALENIAGLRIGPYRMVGADGEELERSVGVGHHDHFQHGRAAQ